MESGETEPVEGNHRVQGTDTDLMDGEAEGDTVVIAGQPEVLSTQAMQVINVALLIAFFIIIIRAHYWGSIILTCSLLSYCNLYIFSLNVSTLKVENELVDLIDELLERDAGTVNSTIIGEKIKFSSGIS